MMNRKRILLCLLAIAFLLAPLAACGAPAAEEPVSQPEPVKEAPPEPTPIPFLQPGEPPEPERILEDTDASLRAYEKRVLGGDNFLNNLYERPFTSREMVYQPDLNILAVSIAADEAFFYFTIVLEGYDEASGRVTGSYGIEFDRTKTGRGDLLVWVSNPQEEEWGTEKVTVFEDTEAVVGGITPIVAETGWKTNGYVHMLEMEGDRVAHARLVKVEQPNVQFAISRALLGNPEEFLWGAWADGGLREPGMFDYNDRMGPSMAGSPMKDSKDYPIKDLFSLDNTCHLPYGFAQSGAIPGMCLVGSEPVDSKCVCVRWNQAVFPPVCVAWSCD